MSRPFYSDAKKAKNVSFSSSSSSHFLFIRDFSGTIEDTDIINTPLEPLRPGDVPFGGFVDITPHFGGEIPQNPNFGGLNTRFHAKLAKYWKFHVIETTALILTKFGITIKTTEWSSWVAPVGAQQIQDGGGRHLKKSQKRDISATVWPIFTKFGTLMQNRSLNRSDR